MDEIICPECGRPNLLEAIKCWYCQTALEKVKERKPKIHDTDEKIVKKEEVPQEKPQEEKDIPEWLKRVRELKAADQPPDEDPNWHQNDLFPSEKKLQKRKTKDKKQSAHKKSTPAKITVRRSQKKKKEPPLAALNKDDKDQERAKSSKKSSDQSPDELPEGYTKL